MRKRPIVLLTDFGHEDPFVGIMRGVIANIAPRASVIDLCHEVPPQDVLLGSVFLKDSYRHFPVGSIFVCVIDPSVGSNRKAVVVKSNNYFFIGPDNGLMVAAASEDGIRKIHELENRQYWLTKTPSATFHGRDIFSPVAAHLRNKPSIFSELGKNVSKLQVIPREAPRWITSKCLQGEILFFDHFGNGITNIKKEDLKKKKIHKINCGRRTLSKLSKRYMATEGKLLALFNSQNRLEFSSPLSSAKKVIKLKKGTKVKIDFY